MFTLTARTEMPNGTVKGEIYKNLTADEVVETRANVRMAAQTGTTVTIEVDRDR